MMVHEIIDGTYRQTNLPNESAEYLAKREALRKAEIELMRQRERVAALRRELPEGPPMQDYAFEEGPASLDAGDFSATHARLDAIHAQYQGLKPYEGRCHGCGGLSHDA